MSTKKSRDDIGCIVNFPTTYLCHDVIRGARQERIVRGRLEGDVGRGRGQRNRVHRPLVRVSYDARNGADSSIENLHRTVRRGADHEVGQQAVAAGE